MTSRLQVQEVCWVTNIPCKFVTFKFLLDDRWCKCMLRTDHNRSIPDNRQFSANFLKIYISNDLPHPFPSFFQIFHGFYSINEALEKRHSAAARLETAEPGPKKINGFPYFCYGDLGDLWAPLHLDCSLPDYPPINIINRTQSHLDSFWETWETQCAHWTLIWTQWFVLFFGYVVFGTRRSTFRGEASSLCKTRIVNWNSRPAMSDMLGIARPCHAFDACDACGLFRFFVFHVFFWRNYGNYLWTNSSDTWVMASKSSTHKKVVSKYYNY